MEAAAAIQVRRRQEKGPNMSRVSPSHGVGDFGPGRGRGPAISEWLALRRKLITQTPAPLPGPDPHSHHVCLFSRHISTIPCPAFASHPNDIPGVLSPFWFLASWPLAWRLVSHSRPVSCEEQNQAGDGVLAGGAVGGEVLSCANFGAWTQVSELQPQLCSQLAVQP